MRKERVNGNSRVHNGGMFSDHRVRGHWRGDGMTESMNLPETDKILPRVHRSEQIFTFCVANGPLTHEAVQSDDGFS